jgi:hypothetical protein
MELFDRLKIHYEQCPPRLSYNGLEGTNVIGKRYSKLPTAEELGPLGKDSLQVWHKKVPATTGTLPVEGYCVIEACLDVTGRSNPDALPLWPEMEGHELYIDIYVDNLNRILMRAIGGFTSYETRERL